MTDQGGVEYFYALESMDDCSYSCDSGYNYIMDAGKGFCVKCKA